MKGDMSDGDAVAQMSERYAALCDVWDGARADARLNEG